MSTETKLLTLPTNGTSLDGGREVHLTRFPACDDHPAGGFLLTLATPAKDGGRGHFLATGQVTREDGTEKGLTGCLLSVEATLALVELAARAFTQEELDGSRPYEIDHTRGEAIAAHFDAERAEERRLSTLLDRAIVALEETESEEAHAIAAELLAVQSEDDSLPSPSAPVRRDEP